MLDSEPLHFFLSMSPTEIALIGYVHPQMVPLNPICNCLELSLQYSFYFAEDPYVNSKSLYHWHTGSQCSLSGLLASHSQIPTAG